MTKLQNIMLLKLLIFSNIIFLSSFLAEAQAPTRFWVGFTDKNNTPYTLSQPLAFLSQRAIDRRTKQNITLNQTDLPVNPAYVAGVVAQGAQVIATSKWLNSVVIYVSDTNILAQIRDLPYVRQVDYVAMKKNGKEGPSIPGDKWDIFNRLNNITSNTPSPVNNSPKSTAVYDYGVSANQIEMIKGDVLHSHGFRGQGMIIAVIDAGFYMADVYPCFDSLRNEGRLLGTKDFVTPGGNVYTASSHGMMVLSTMAANLPGEIIGTAPKASYWLLRSEDTGSEYPVEEDFWVSAAEFADSIGADVINSSLGYTQFDDFTLNHTQAQMDGNTAPSTIGADFAASKGILVVTAAGNSGGSAWQIISAPADGDSVLAVGAVDENGMYAMFSSTGPSADGRVKPNVSTEGQGSIVYSPFGGGVISGNGTSFASPIMAGAAACLWQAHPQASNMDILNAIQSSASQFSNPDIYMGYGIPNLEIADKKLYIPPAVVPFSGMMVFPNPSHNTIGIKVFFDDYQDITLVVYDRLGRKVLPDFQSLCFPGENHLKLNDTETLPAGIYLISLKAGSNLFLAKWMKM